MLMDAARRNGHTITQDWTVAVEKMGAGDPKEHIFEDLQKHALADKEGVRTCDLFIILRKTDMRGAWVEYGMAVAYEKPIWIVEFDEVPFVIFTALPRVRVLYGWEAMQEIEHSEGRELVTV